jgi:hypothetical protein
MLTTQADLVCACENFECGMDVLEGPINEKLKKMDEGGKVDLSDEAKAQKKRMMGCLLALKAKDLGADDQGADAGKTEPAKEPAKPFESAEGRFTAVFPFPTENKTSTDQNKVEWQEVKAKTGMYTVSYSDFPDAEKAQGYIDNFVKTMSKEITNKGDVKTGDKGGLEVEMKVSERATMWLRMFAVDKRVYKVAAGTKNDKAKAYAFLDTFKIN